MFIKGNNCQIIRCFCSWCVIVSSPATKTPFNLTIFFLNKHDFYDLSVPLLSRNSSVLDLYDPLVLLLLRFLLSKKNPEPVTLCHYHMTWPSVFSALNWGALLTKLWIPTLHTRLPDITVCWKLLQLTKNVCFSLILFRPI